MKQKTISLPEDIYNQLKKTKKTNETFSQLILKLLEKDRNQTDISSFESFAGILSEDDEWDDIEIQLEKAREIPRSYYPFAKEKKNVK